MAKNKWITLKQAAKELNVTIQAVNNWITRGKIDWKIEPNYGIKLVNPTSVRTDKRKKRVKSS